MYIFRSQRRFTQQMITENIILRVLKNTQMTENEISKIVFDAG
ncbi:hypothetical protein SAMN05880574_10585 [Chryseobacterium sp. RU37D]|nr:hypothetical protein SAMN05880574_10585 [Chryseobacterium sp. RU37D]